MPAPFGTEALCPNRLLHEAIGLEVRAECSKGPATTMRRFRKTTGSRLCGDSDNERRTLGGAGDYVDAYDLVLGLRIFPGQLEQPQRNGLSRRCGVSTRPSQDSPANALRLVGEVPPIPQVLGVNERDFLVGSSSVMHDILANLDSISFTTGTGV